MKHIKWLVDLASRNPLIFYIAVSLIVNCVMGIAVANRDKKLHECRQDNTELQINNNKRFDSLVIFYRNRDAIRELEGRELMRGMISDYREQVAEQRKINDDLKETVNTSKKLVRTTQSKIKNLNNEKY